MVNLFLTKPNWKQENTGKDSNLGKQWVILLKKLESIIWSFVTSGGGGKSEARLWLCNSVAAINSLTPRQQRDLFVKLLRKRPVNKSLASQVLHMMFEKRRKEVGDVLAKRSYLLEKFFDGNPVRIMQWFSNFADNGGLNHKKGAKALSQFAFVNRDICWEELQWKGKHGQSPAVVATKPHYFLDLDVQKTVENFIEYVPEFWSSDEFAQSLRDGNILSIDTKYFVEFFLGLMYEEDARDVWDVMNEFLTEETFSSLCSRLLITLEEGELCTVLELLGRNFSLQTEPEHFENSSCWLEFVFSEFKDCDTIDEILLLNAVAIKGRQLLRLLLDEESEEEQAKVKDIISQICTISSSINSMLPLLNECLKLHSVEAVKLLGLQSWVIHHQLLEQPRSLESWESLFSNNGISFKKSDKYAFVDHICSEEYNSGSDDDALIKRKHRKKKKSKKRRRNFDDDDELLLFDRSNDSLGLQSRAVSWCLSTDGFSASWTNIM
ncbi:uncharacterized protein LOC126655041 isoform X2 [Mercurialis annua]|uniref:uncharacterized protein LOC126655041 isoform X2 n=1 Tax=Mercurialis annua TaxID=3986 RepID=UPI00215F718D|nr:uncharacterized protein LOC126655041 isoform X2 [Mercurialis annua]